METVKCTVSQAYELRALLLGLQLRNDKGEVQQIYPGFVTEKGISEGMKRIAHKAARVITTELEAIDKQRKEITEFKPEPTEGDIVEHSAEELTKIRNAKDQELLAEELEFEVEQPDFSKIENLSLSFDYSALYEKLFKNY